MAQERDLAREVLRASLPKMSLRELDRRMGRSQNYTSRVLAGRGVVVLSFDVAFEILDAAGVSRSEFLRRLADQIDRKALAEEDREVHLFREVAVHGMDAVAVQNVLRAALEPLVARVEALESVFKAGGSGRAKRD
jgi:hypothetical protein